MNKMMILATAAAAAIAAPAAAAGFETGTLEGFTAVGTAGVTTNYGAFTAAEGTQFAFIQAGLGESVPSTLTKTFALLAGQSLSGSVGFQANDYIPFNDYASLTVNGTQIFFSNIAAVGNYGNSGWVSYNFVAPTAGNYTLQLSVANIGDNGLSSAAVLDGVMGGAVPEPSAWALMILGFGAIGAGMRRRSTSAVRFA